MNYTDNCYPFRQDSSFIYFFGLDHPGLNAVIDIDNDEEIIFGDELSIDHIVWMGPQDKLVDQCASVGIRSLKPSNSLQGFLQKAVDAKKAVHFLPPYRAANTLKLSEWLEIPANSVKDKASVELIHAIISIRSIKSNEEVNEIGQAVNIAREMHIMANELARDGEPEYRIKGAIAEIVDAKQGYFGYTPIITVNGQTLHNHNYGNTLQRGQLLLVDAGASVASHYTADITRTFPVGGQFSDKQRDVYDIVLRAEVESIQNCKPGVTYKEVHHSAMKILTEGLTDLGLMKGDAEAAVMEGAHALFCPHGLGHMIGLDVHDMEDLGEDYVGYSEDVKRSNLFGTKSLRLGRKLETGFTLTVEPGLYFIPELIDIWKSEGRHKDFINYSEVEKYLGFGGIRIEDNILITESGSMILGKPIPKNVEDIQF